MKKLILVASLVSTLSSCGTVTNLTHKKAQSATQKDGGATGTSDCLFLGDAAMPDYGKPVDDGYDHGTTDVPVYVPPKDIPQGPNQNPNYPPAETTVPNFDVTVPQPPVTTQPPQYQPPGPPTQQPPTQQPPVTLPPAKPTAPCKAPTQTPTQTPAQSKGDSKGDAYHPIGTEPQPYPTQAPVVATECGKDGKMCDYGPQSPTQYPAQTSVGQSYDQKDVDGCMEAFRNSGYDTKGMWNVVVKEAKVSVLSHSTVTDTGSDHALVIINSVSVLGSMDYQLLNPNALYCIKSVSVLQNTHVASCLGSNVVFGKDVSVLARAHNDIVNCH